jgi:hypothetical protein
MRIREERAGNGELPSSHRLGAISVARMLFGKSDATVKPGSIAYAKAVLFPVIL